MDKSWSFLLGALATILFSLSGLVLIPNWQFEELKPIVDQSGNPHPIAPAGSVLLGREVYIAEGCLYCHSQQVPLHIAGHSALRVSDRRHTSGRPPHRCRLA